MGNLLFSETWVDQFMKETLKGPSPERKEKVDENYWNWIEERKKTLDIRLGLVLKKQNPEDDQYGYFDIVQGSVVQAYSGTSSDRGTADFILAGTEEDWYEIIAGNRELTQNMMYRRIRLVQGNLHEFFRSIYYFVELLRCGIRVPTEFELIDQASKV
ncbi:hypothetical protein [Neobacillus muris]|uniref:hypothetical protein n=1 Tax=Neobacillus muris TaxID=2941334 RepID=UPI00203A5DEF|nr:hypothetical protein [Neobacillus muris]